MFSDLSTTVQATIGGNSSQQVDVFLLFDDTGSFAGTAPLLIDEFSNVVSQLQTNLPNVDFGFGVGRFEDERNVFPFVLNQPIGSPDNALFQTALTQALNRTAPGNGGDSPETALEGLYQIATGVGFDGDGDGLADGNGPAGAPLTQVIFNSFDTSAYNTFVSTETGIDFGYRIVSADVAEDYRLGEVVDGNLDSTGAAAVYRFNAQKDTSFFLKQLIDLEGVEFVIVNPDGTVLSSNINLTNGDFESSQTGEHLLLVRKTSRSSTRVVDFEFQIREAQIETLAEELDAAITGSIAEAGDQVRYDFEIDQDMIVYLRRSYERGQLALVGL